MVFCRANSLFQHKDSSAHQSLTAKLKPHTEKAEPVKVVSPFYAEKLMFFDSSHVSFS